MLEDLCKLAALDLELNDIMKAAEDPELTEEQRNRYIARLKEVLEQC